MQIIIAPAKSGKTTKLAELVKNDPHGILVIAEESKDHIADRFGLDIQRIKTDIEISEGALQKEPNCVKLYIDDVDSVLRTLLGKHIEALTIRERR